MEASTGTVLYDKNMHEQHYPASITKIMTALLAIENCDMDEMVTVPHEAVYMEDKGSHIALDEGEELRVETACTRSCWLPPMTRPIRWRCTSGDPLRALRI